MTGEAYLQKRRQAARSRIALALYPVFLGMAPVLGKMAYNGGSDPFTVAALRTVVAAGLLWIAYFIFWRRYIYIFPAGLVGCIAVGTVNGVGSLFYYNGLHYLSASVAQLLNSTYLIFVIVLALVAGLPLTMRTVVRAMLALIAVTLITQGAAGQFSWLGAGLMIGNAILFAGTVILSQRVLYEMPSQTVTLYVLTTMAVVVVMARTVYRLEWIPQSPEALTAILALGLTTALSRLTMFLSVKKMGSTQTVLVGIFETVISLLMAFLFLGDHLSIIQWVGVGVLLLSLLLLKRHELDKRATGEVPVFHMTGVMAPTTLNRMAFIQAFGNGLPHEDEVSPEELELIQRTFEAGRQEPLRTPDK